MPTETEIVAEIERALEGSDDRSVKFRRVAETLRHGAGYRWVGIYEVTGDEIVGIAWTGDEPPVHRRFPVSKGLSGEAVRRRATIVAGDVLKDPRYLTTFNSTRSEIVVPVLDTVTGRPRALIDVESDRPDAFGPKDRALLERCAAEIATAISPSPG